MIREERASKSPRFVISDASVVCAKNTKHLAVVEASAAAAATSSSICFPAAFGVQLSKNRGRVETSAKPKTNVQGADRGTAVGVHDGELEFVNGTNGRTTKLRHSFSDSDLHK